MVCSVPPRLKEIQKWFGSIITKPLRDDQTSQDSYALELAPVYISPSPTLEPHDRVQIYNQQYWWRLYDTLQNMFPSVVRIFGYGDFNRLIIIPYLTAYPSSYWSLNYLGTKMMTWLRAHYKEQDRSLVLQTAAMDWAFHYSFTAKKCPAITANTDLSKAKLRLQPHALLIKCDGPFFEFREALLKESVEHWIENDFPPIPKDRAHYYLIYRNTSALIVGKEVSAAEYKLLRSFKSGTTLEQVCAAIEDEKPELFEECLAHIQQWCQEWTAEEILATASR